MRKKRRFFAYMAASAYRVISKEKENQIFRHNWIFRHTCVYKQSTLTKWWNYDMFVQIWYTYFRYTGRLFLGCCRKIVTGLWETKKEKRLSYRRKYTEEFVWGTSLFWLHALLSISFFVALFVYYFFQLTYLLDGPTKDTYCYEW